MAITNSSALRRDQQHPVGEAKTYVLSSPKLRDGSAAIQKTKYLWKGTLYLATGGSTTVEATTMVDLLSKVERTIGAKVNAVLTDQGSTWAEEKQQYATDMTPGKGTARFAGPTVEEARAAMELAGEAPRYRALASTVVNGDDSQIQAARALDRAAAEARAREAAAREQSPEQIAAVFNEWLKTSNFGPFANDPFTFQQLSDALDYLRHHCPSIQWEGVTKNALTTAWKMCVEYGCVSKPGQISPTICEVYGFKRTPSAEETLQAAIQTREQAIAQRRQEIERARNMSDEELQDAARKSYNRKVDPRDYSIKPVRF